MRLKKKPTTLSPRSLIQAIAVITAISCIGFANQGFAQNQPAVQQNAAQVDLTNWQVPDISKMPDGPNKKIIEYGKELTERTYAVIGPEVQDKKMRYAGNNLACVSCHQASATKPYAMPFTGVSAKFPQYRGREDDISTVEERVNGCMERSMNGHVLPLDSREMKAFVAYIAFLSQSIPMGQVVKGASIIRSEMPDRSANPIAGLDVYKAKCAACHGENGQGQRNGVAGDAKGYLFPPLWGNDSFNTGAGMNRLMTATRFIKHNMPLGAKHDAILLSDDEAYDVAAYMVSQPRPVKSGLDKDFPARWNKPVDAAFEPYLQGQPEEHKYGPFKPLLQKQKQMQPQLKKAAAKASK